MNTVAAAWRTTNKWIFGSSVLIAGVGLITFWNALDIGFWTDDYEFLETAGRINWYDYRVTYFDPRVQWHWYRPLQGVEWKIGYTLFGVVPMGYHLIQILLHLANVLWLFALVYRITRRWRPAFLSAMFYVTLPAYSLAVAWPGVADPLVAVFFLTTLWLWLDFCECGGWWRYSIALVAFLATILSKEIGAVLPIVLFLADRWLVRRPATFAQLVKRYALFVATLAVYGLLELNVLTRGVFTQSLGYGIGGHIPSTLLNHLATLAFPWDIHSMWNYAAFVVGFALFAYAVYRRAWSILFLNAAILLTLLPILPFPSNIASAPRYLYVPLMGAMIGLGLLVDQAFSFFDSIRGSRLALIGLSLAVVTLVGWQAATTAESVLAFGGTVRVERLRFRPVFQQHPNLAPGTLLYFIAPDNVYISGLVFSRYGSSIVGESTETGHLVGLRDYPQGFVFYRDEENNWREQTVAKDLTAQWSPTLPVRFGESIMLERAELTANRVKRGEVLIAILYWKTSAAIDKDWSVFVQVVNPDGQTIAGIDALLLKGNAPTSHWRINDLAIEGMVIPVDADMPPGDYQLELGVYYLPTLERLPVTDNQGNLASQVVVKPFTIH